MIPIFFPAFLLQLLWAPWDINFVVSNFLQYRWVDLIISFVLSLWDVRDFWLKDLLKLTESWVTRYILYVLLYIRTVKWKQISKGSYFTIQYSELANLFFSISIKTANYPIVIVKINVLAVDLILDRHSLILKV